MLTYTGRAEMNLLITGQKLWSAQRYWFGLYTNAYVWGNNPFIGVDIIEATFAGYVKVQGANFVASIIPDGYGNIISSGDPITFSNTGAADIQVYGFFVQDELFDPQPLGGAAFPSVVSIPAGQSYVLKPQILVNTLDDPD